MCASALSWRHAAPQDIPALTQVIAASSRALCAKDYTPAQIEAALQGAWGVDTQLVADQTYFVIEGDGQILGCGGWSFRETLFGGDAYSDRSNAPMDPATSRAKVRAFFVSPDAAGRGVGDLMLKTCEDAAASAGFLQTELMATLTGARFYARHGYSAEGDHVFELNGVGVPFIKMGKQLEAG